MSVPVRRQGTPLPPDFPYQGEWLDMPRIFLWLPTPEQQSQPGKPQLAAEINPGLEDWCFGFDATQLAAALEVSTDVLFAANRNGELALTNVEVTQDASAKRYTFQLGAKTAAPVFERFPVVGRA